ncbi:hypothetical protein B0H16DRAFT_726359 [Mycena metata]|uniref:DUF6534 domain-containing protein n=1 Tax=Mycena metata TaxID=1033252 RepID=A0AAD7K7G7_9AGAR|nr:hypothetical protein B0H16DRAFT_726359 [Mycena metata]
MNSTGSPPGFVIVEQTGPLLLGFSMDWALFAVLTVQLYLYYQAFPNDMVFTKVLVYTVYCINLTQVIFVTIDAFDTFGYRFGDPSALSTAFKWLWLVAPIFGGIVACIVQSFYAFRLYRLSGSRIVPSIIAFAALSICAIGIFDGIAGQRLPNHHHGANVSTTLAVITMLFLVGTALIDMTIAGCMTYYLTKNDAGFRRTHTLVTKLIRLSIETGLITAVAAVLIVVLFLGIPGKVYYVVPGSSMSNIYANTLLAVLNSRFQILNGRRDVPTSNIDISIPSNLPSTVGGPVVSIPREEFSDGSNQALELKQMNVRSVHSPVSTAYRPLKGTFPGLCHRGVVPHLFK